jgi:hypothetical protein
MRMAISMCDNNTGAIHHKHHRRKCSNRDVVLGTKGRVFRNKEALKHAGREAAGGGSAGCIRRTKRVILGSDGYNQRVVGQVERGRRRQRGQSSCDGSGDGNT